MFGFFIGLPGVGDVERFTASDLHGVSDGGDENALFQFLFRGSRDGDRGILCAIITGGNGGFLECQGDVITRFGEQGFQFSIFGADGEGCAVAGLDLCIPVVEGEDSAFERFLILVDLVDRNGESCSAFSSVFLVLVMSSVSPPVISME